MMAIKADSNEIDLNDKETRTLLHSDKAIRSASVKSGAATGLVAGLAASPILIEPILYFMKKAKELGSAEPLWKRITTIAKQKKLAAVLAAVVPAAAAVGATIGYYTTKKNLKEKQKELVEIEAKEKIHATANDTVQDLPDRKTDWVKSVTNTNRRQNLGR